MCGIAGMAGFGEEDPSPRINSMLKALARRGPDDEGRHCWPGAALAHRRLSIIDLSAGGHQPMLSDDGRVGLVFNGCIYNFAEIRRELEDAGHLFRSHCDTEVILRGYQEWGAARLVPRLRGMFAFAIWDDPRQKLTLVRDRLGVKPLCYSTRGQMLAFASTPAALKAAGLAGEINPEAVLEFLEFGFVTEDRCIFNEIHKVPPASVLEWHNGRMESSIYWDEPRPAANQISFEAALEETEARLLEAVRIRLVADVPISALLSGGIDSTLVCWALAKLGAPVKAFTVSLPGEREDEALHAQATAQKIGIAHERIGLPELQPDILDTEVAAFSEPFAAYSALGMLQLSKAIKPFATVMLTGDGGDEAFLGYPVHLHSYRAQMLAKRLPPFSPSAWRLLRPLIQPFGGLRRAKHFLDYSTGGLGALTQVHEGLPFYCEQQLLGPRLAVGEIKQRQIAASFSSARRLLGDLLEYNRVTEFTGEFLTKIDGTTMHYAIEARSPFLDHQLWEFASSLDFSTRLRGGRLKSVLRELVSRRVGAEVANRPKQGFQIPVDRWLVRQLRPKLDELGNGSKLAAQGWIKKEPLKKLVARAIETGSANVHLWRLVVLNSWLDRQP
jgi:asparagine synthase (glutamine-hydrolysing)